MAIVYLPNVPKKDNAPRTWLSPNFVDSMLKLFKNSMKPDINSIENSVDPDQLASEEAS